MVEAVQTSPADRPSGAAGAIRPKVPRLSRILATAFLATALFGCGDAENLPSSSDVPRAVVSGPVLAGIRGFPATPAVVDLAASGYVEEEFFVDGMARAFRRDGDWSIDGVWPVVEDSRASYRTRALVRRPAEARRFSGVVIVEWFNVSSGVDLDPDFGFLSAEILREGHVWVGVSAQSVSFSGGGEGPFGPNAVGLRDWDPERYGSLSHPGDAYSYDIFAQVGAVLRSPGAVDPLVGLRPRILLADGESQSAFRMLTYVNAIHPIARVYDGFLIHSRNGTGASLGDGEAVPAPARVRVDGTAPVFQFVTETDLFDLGAGDFAFPGARQSDSTRVHTWEVAGTAHADRQYLMSLLAQGRRQFEGFLDLTPVLEVVNRAPQNLAMHAALHALVDWIEDGTPPASAPPIETSDGAIVRDERGNALGGVRLPHVEVPVALHSGEDGVPLSGRTVPFDEATLRALYPDPARYAELVRSAAEAARDAGFLLAADVDLLVAEAQANPPYRE